MELLVPFKLEKGRILGVDKWEIKKSVSYMLLLLMAFYTYSFSFGVYNISSTSEKI